MTLGLPLGSSSLVDVYADGADVLKLYHIGVGPERARHESDVLQHIRHLPLRTPLPGEVVYRDGRWGLRMSRLPGQPLRLPPEGNDDIAVVAGQLAGLQRQVHEFQAMGVPSLKTRLADRIGRAAPLTDVVKQRLHERLEALPHGHSLCHGDFHPGNIIDQNGQFGIIDWLDASSGTPAADFTRSYLLFRHHAPWFAEAYLHATGLSSDDLADWLPIIAAARLTENVPDEVDWLLSLVHQA